MVFFGDNEYRALVFLNIAQAVDKETDTATVKKRRALEVENKVMVSLTDEFGNLVIQNLGAFGSVDVSDDMDHLELPDIFHFIFHADSSFNDPDQTLWLASNVPFK